MGDKEADRRRRKRDEDEKRSKRRGPGHEKNSTKKVLTNFPAQRAAKIGERS